MRVELWRDGELEADETRRIERLAHRMRIYADAGYFALGVEAIGVDPLAAFRLFRERGWTRCMHRATTGVARIDGTAQNVFLFLLTPDVRAMVADLLAPSN